MIFATLVSLSKVIVSGNGRRPLELESVEKVATKEEESVGGGELHLHLQLQLVESPNFE